jgi:hypothetical protein
MPYRLKMKRKAWNKIKTTKASRKFVDRKARNLPELIVWVG